MVFSSLVFLFRFLPLTLLLYYIVPKRLRNLVLFLASILFYAWGEPIYVVLILASTLLDYTTGRMAGYYREQGRDSQARLAVFLSASINLLLLGVFKYADFFVETVNLVLPVSVPKPGLMLPIGISFYTFQTMSYTIDVYRGDAKVQKNLITFGAYVALFPQLIAGPIVRYKSVAEQLVSRRETVGLFFDGMIRFTAGLGKKVLIANPIGVAWKEIAAMEAGQLTTAAAWIGLVAFGLQLYFDFSGYSDMAIGLGKMFGFSFPENFQYPYEAKSITEFWRRWHISLGTWFREYVYIPLGGNRKGTARQMLYITIVWALTGLWHGANWNFVLWGLYSGALLVLEKRFLLKKLERLPRWSRHIYVMIGTLFGFALFSCSDMQNSVEYLRAMFFRASAGMANPHDGYLLRSYAVLFVVGIVGSTSFLKRFATKKGLTDVTWINVGYMAAILVLCVAMLVNSSYNPFLYFRF